MEICSRILVTGANGMVGSAVVSELKAQGFCNVVGIGRGTCDLLSADQTLNVFRQEKPEFVFHSAARVYGILGNIKNKGQSFYENNVINTNVIHAARLVGVKKITVMGTGAVYPYPPPALPLHESMIFSGRPHPSEDSYAQAKRAMLAMLEAYEESYDLKWSYLVSCNLYGPNDKFDVNFGHVVPSLVKKFYDATISGGNAVVWGDGSARRDFMYVRDAARAALVTMRELSGVVNLGSGSVSSIRDVVECLTFISGLRGRIDWDSSKPNGQDYRAYDLGRLQGTGFRATYSLQAGLRETWDWYSAEMRRASINSP